MRWLPSVVAAYLALSAILCLLAQDREPAMLRIIACGVFLILGAITRREEGE